MPQVTANYKLTFKTINLDYGFFFLGASGEYQKADAGQSNPYYDANKPTIVSFHGRQNCSTKNENFENDNELFFNSSIIGSWRNKGKTYVSHIGLSEQTNLKPKMLRQNYDLSTTGRHYQLTKLYMQKNFQDLMLLALRYYALRLSGSLN